MEIDAGARVFVGKIARPGHRDHSFRGIVITWNGAS